MKVQRMKEILSALPDDDEIIVVWWDYDEMGDHAEEQGVTLSRQQWATVVKKFERRLNIDAPLIQYIDLLVAEYGTSIDESCPDCGDDPLECGCNYCVDCDETLDECTC